jgi:hypothetical protein
LALQPLCWTLLLPALLQCMPAQGVLELLQAHLSTAAGSVTGLAQMCDVVAALDASGCGVQAAGMVRSGGAWCFCMCVDFSWQLQQLSYVGDTLLVAVREDEVRIQVVLLPLQVSQSLAASLAAGDTRGTLAVLLLAGHLLRRGAWGKGQYLGMLQQAGTTLQEGHAGR